MASAKGKRLSPATVIALIAVAITMSGTAYAALAPHSVGTRQIKAGAIVNSKLAPNAIDSAKVAKHSLSGRNFALSSIGRVPNAENAERADAAKSLAGYDSSCPANTVLSHGLCFDAAPSGPVTGVKTAADKCTEAGGFLPTPAQLLAAKGALNLGDGNGSHAQFTDSLFVDPGAGQYMGIDVISQAGEKMVPLNNSSNEIVATYEYTCVYQSIR